MSCYCERTEIDASYTGTTDLPITPGDTVVVIFGSRAYDSVPGSLSDKADTVIDQFDERELPLPDVIVSGGAGGADAVAEAVAITLSVPMIVFAVNTPSANTDFRRTELASEPWAVETVATYDGDPDDPRSGRGAYLYRNCLMAELVGQHGGHGFAIYNGESSGTSRMLTSCDSHGVDTTVWRYDRN